MIVSMKTYRLNASFQIMGGFWLHGHENESFTGVLSCHEGQTNLVSSPRYEIIDESKPEQAFRDAIEGVTSRQIETLCGFTTEGPCTVLYAVRGDRSGLYDTPNRRNISADRYDAGGTLLGLQIESQSIDCLYEASFYYNKIHHLLPASWSLSVDNAHTSYKSSWTAVEVFSFCSLSLRSEIICEVLPLGGGKRNSTKIKSVPRIRIVSQMPRSLEWFRSLAVRIENFFTLFVGTSVELTRFAVHEGEKMGWLVQKTARKCEKTKFQCWVRCSSSQMARALAIWLAVPEEKRPVEKTVLGLMRKSSIFYETEFLSLAQALEAFGRIKFSECLIPKRSSGKD